MSEPILRSEITVNEEFHLHLYEEREKVKEWSVWLDPLEGFQTGVVIGVGSNRTCAVEKALLVLAHLTANVLKLK